VTVDQMPGEDAVLTLDVLGRRCPAPIIELARHIGDVQVGAIVRVLADDPAAALDIPAWCQMRGQEFLGTRAGAYEVRRVR